VVVPVAVPLPPRSFVHVTCVTPTVSAAVPPSVRGEVLVLKVGVEVGEVIATVGAVVSVAPPARAIALTVVEQLLSFPPTSTAVTATW
jgi:hypothetical protein